MQILTVVIGMGMPPSDTGRTREESEALESKGITNEINFRMYSATTFYNE